MPPKRPIRNVFDDDEEEHGPDGTPPKKARAEAGTARATANGVTSIQAQVAAAKARAQALMAAMQNKGSQPPTAPAPARAPAPPSAPAATAAAAATRPASGSIQAQLEAARARVQAQVAALNSKTKPPAASSSAPRPADDRIAGPSSASSTSTATSSRAPTGIHPLLLSNAVPKVDTIRGKPAVPPESNPYLQASRAAADESGEGPKARSMRRGFHFHKPGRHIEEAEELRHEAHVAALQRRLEESARQPDHEDNLRRPAPPDIEWWDSNLLSTASYDAIPDLSPTSLLTAEESPLLLQGAASVITAYVQHPIPIPAPSDSIEVRQRGLMLTKSEARKLRRQRRAAAQQDTRDRIKMGLLPPEPARVKLSNLMRVLTSDAVADPTKVEARVRREIAARQDAHERHNAERKLTPQQRREKAERRKEAEEKKGLFCQVYRVKHLVSPAHKFKVRRNAQDHALTGLTVFHPDMALVVVEGSAKALKAYKRLMTVRIDWTEPGEAKPKPDTADAEGEEKVGAWTLLTTSTEAVDWSSNACDLVFEGPIRDRSFAGRPFRAVWATTDADARTALGSMQGYWDVAKRSTTDDSSSL